MAYQPTVDTGRTSGNFQAVTPNDSTDLPGGQSLGLYVGTSGSLVVLDNYGHTVTFANAPVGYHPLRATRVLSTGTTASNIVALY